MKNRFVFWGIGEYPGKMPAGCDDTIILAQGAPLDPVTRLVNPDRDFDLTCPHHPGE